MSQPCQRVTRRCAAVLALLAAAGCRDPATQAREARKAAAQVSPAPSPDGRHVARVDILEHPCVKGFDACWVVSVQRRDGGEVFRDAEGFPARFHVYWKWDAAGRLWLYNSDDGDLVVYRQHDGRWGRVRAAETGGCGSEEPVPAQRCAPEGLPPY